MLARYPGVCSLTGTRFAPGTEIVKGPDGWEIDYPQMRYGSPVKMSTDRMTIEPCYENPVAGTPAGGFTVYQHGVYPLSSVLSGQPRRTYLEHFETREEAQAEYPYAEQLEYSTYQEPVEMSRIAPSWFDESAAGERWDDDY